MSNVKPIVTKAGLSGLQLLSKHFPLTVVDELISN